MKRAIVTGACGFVGRYLVGELFNNNYQIVAIDRPGSDTEVLPTIAEFFSCDLDDLPHLSHQLQGPFDYFFHLAWRGVSGEAQGSFDVQYQNIGSTLAALRLAKKLGCSRFIGGGSIQELELLREMELPQPAHNYGNIYKTSKLAAHYFGRLEADRLGIDFLWPRLTNTYGAGESSPRLINWMIRQLMDGQEPALTEADQLYDFIYVTDTAAAFRLIAEKGLPNKKYVIGSGQVRPLREFLEELRDIVSPGVSLGFGKHKFTGVYMTREDLDISALFMDTGFHPNTAFQEGIQQTQSWIKFQSEG